MKACIAIVTSFLLLCGTAVAQRQDRDPQLRRPSERGSTTALIAKEVRHELLTLPWYGVFDWFEAEILPDDTVILRGQVTRPTLKSGAEKRVKEIESVAKVVNQIEVLPLSAHDDEIRRAVYRELFNFNSPLFRYAQGADPSIHIIVKGGRVTLKGVVSSPMDKQLAAMAARGVPGTFEVTDELVVEKPISD
jgi:hyperosmotically inducible protein